MTYKAVVNEGLLFAVGGKLTIFILLVIFTSSALPTFASVSEAESADDVGKIIKRAEKLSRAESLTEAEAVLRQAVALDPKRSAARVELAYVLTKQRKLVEAYKLAYDVAEAEGKNARAYSVLGMVLLTAGRFEEARIVFFSALKLDRTQDLAWAGYGLLNFYENKIDESIIKLREAVHYGSNEPDHWFAHAQVSARAEKYTEAAESYRTFLRVSSVTDEDRRERIKGLIRFLLFLGQRNSLYKNAGEDQSVVNFELVGNRPIVSVRINENPEPLRFVLDTGSGITVLSEKSAEKLKLKPVTKGGFARGIGGDGRFEIVYGFLRRISIGDVALQNVPIYIRRLHNDQEPVDGYIGLALISKFLTTIDYGDQTFALTRTEADRAEFRDNSSMSLPLRLTSSGFLSGEVHLQGLDSSLNFIVDTGASISVISDRVANIESISLFASDERLRVIGSAGATHNVPTFMLPKVSIGPHSRKQISAVALDLDLINEASGFEQAGILGGNFLKNYRMTFDFRNSIVMFTSINPE